ncbi:low molecular weight phosphatase family protein [Mycobacterium sp. ITM-2017-0098]|nr:low molecular weight phosphatase family protein [Mycobacterium sp. ITM-2017-0098]
MHILFVCTGNICRSPTAERLAVAYAAEMGIGNLGASSAGTNAVSGHRIHDEAAIVLRQLGGDPSGFAARQLTANVASSADLILTMTAKHRDCLLELCPSMLSRTFLLTEASRLVSEFDAASIADLAALRPRLTSRERPDIPDPIGQSPAVFESVVSQIAEVLYPIMALCRTDE